MVSGFSHDASTYKTWERQLCEVQETWGQLTARAGISKHSEDGVTSKTNPTHNPSAACEESRGEPGQGWENRRLLPIRPSEVSEMFLFLDYCVLLATVLFVLLFLTVCEQRCWANTTSNLKTQMFDRKLNNVATPCLPSQKSGFILCWEQNCAGGRHVIDVNK